MAIGFSDKEKQNVGSWQELFVPSYTERVKKLRENAIRTPEICLERMRTEMKVYEQYKNEPRIIQRARFLETFLREKTIKIYDNELIIGSINSKVRGSTIVGGDYTWLEKELDDPERDPEIRTFDRHIIHPEERKELKEVIFPYFKGKTLGDYNRATLNDDLKEHAFAGLSSCPHIPAIADWQMNGDIGHQMANYEKVLHKGLKGIREEVEYYQAQVDQPYDHYQVQQKKDFYKAVLISIDAAIAYAKRYSDLAKEMATKEANPSGKKNCYRLLRSVHRSRPILHATGGKLCNPSGCCMSLFPANWPRWCIVSDVSTSICILSTRNRSPMIIQ